MEIGVQLVLGNRLILTLYFFSLVVAEVEVMMQF